MLQAVMFYVVLGCHHLWQDLLSGDVEKQLEGAISLALFWLLRWMLEKWRQIEANVLYAFLPLISTKSWCGALARNEGRDTEAVSDVELSWLKQQTEPPRKLTWNLKISTWKRRNIYKLGSMLVFGGVICWYFPHVSVWMFWSRRQKRLLETMSGKDTAALNLSPGFDSTHIWVQWECWMNILQHNFLFLFVRPWRKKVAELLCNLQLERLHLSWPRSLKPSTAHKENSAAVWWQDDQCFHQFHPVPMDWIWSLSIRLKGVRDDLSAIAQCVVLHSRWVISAWKLHSLHFGYKGPAFASSPSKALGHQVIWKSNAHHHVTAWSMPGRWDRLYGFARHMTWGNL